jgi:Ca2+/Na+ antiporter
LKTFAIQIGKLIGSVLLLIVLVKGISATLLYASTAKDWVFENEDGDYTNVRFSVASFGGLILWFWLLYKIRRADMNDEDKKDSDRHAISSEDENQW